MTHYWEGMYLKTLQQKLKDEKEGALKSSRKAIEDWQMRAMVTPCLVTSFDVLPKLFHLEINNYSTVVQDAIDLIVVPDGDKILPSMALPSMIFAKKCLVLGEGDPQAWNLPQGIQVGNLVSSGFEGDVIIEKMKAARD